MRLILRLLLMLGLLWTGAVGGALLFRHALIYPFVGDFAVERIAGLPRGRVVTLPAPDGVSGGLPITAWVADPLPGHPVILHFTGNAGWLPAGAIKMREFVQRGYGTAILAYRGAGDRPGSPDQAALTADALALYDALPTLFRDREEPPVVYGVSLGAALAVQLSARRPVASLVLEAPFTRLCEAGEYAYPVLPACLLMWDEHWDSLQAIGEVDAPVLVLHGEADRVIPVDQGERLFAAASEPKELILYPAGRHNDLRLYGAGTDIIAWLEGLGARP